ncbi:MAG: CHASE domain-containing protein, partial [Candidatus Omnitrophota bacterium]
MSRLSKGLIKPKYFFAIFILISGILLSFALSRTAYQWENNNIETAFDLQANDRVQVVIDSLNDHVDLLSSMVDFYEASEKVTRKEFYDFTKRIFILHPDILSLSWIPRVLHSERPAFEETVHLEGYQDFQITDLKDENLVKSAYREEYFPVYYAEPFDENKVTIGFDLYSDLIRRKAIDQARDTGIPSATGKIRLLREANGGFSCRIFMPLYKKQVPVATIEQRRENLTGFVSLLFRVGPTVDNALSRIGGAGVNLSLYEGPITDPNNFLYYYNSEPYAYKAVDNPTQVSNNSYQQIMFTKEFKMADRIWFIVCRPTESFFLAYKHISSWVIFICGMLITLVLTAYIFSILNRAQRVESIVKERTMALNNLNDEVIKISRHNELILASIGEGILGLDVNGNHIFVNPSAVKMLGFTVSELIGKPIHIWYHSKEENSGHPSQECPILMAIRDGQVHTVRDEVFYRKDG